MKDFLDLAPNMDVLDANSEDMKSVDDQLDANGNCNVC